MTRAYIGEWGRELSPDWYSCALAALGVLVYPHPRNLDQNSLADPELLATQLGRRWDASPERLDWGIYDRALWERAKQLISPDVAAKAWQNFSERLPTPPRLLIVSQYMSDANAAATYFWLNQALMHTQSRVGSAFFEWWLNTRAGSAIREREAWHWPLRIGFLPDGESRELKRMIELAPAWFYNTLVLFSVLTAGTEACDLLLSPLDAAGTLAGVEEARARASLVLLTGPSVAATEDAFVELMELRNTTCASAIGVVGCGDLTSYLTEFLRNVAHDEPLDAALHGAVKPTGKLPLVIATQSFIGKARISAIPNELADRLARYGMAAEASSLINEMQGLYFDSEEHGASVMLERMRTFADDLRSRPPRFIHARTQRWDSEHRRLRDAVGFARAIPHLVSIHVGPHAPGERPSLPAFPDGRIRWSRDPERLTVVLTAPHCKIQALGEAHTDDFDPPELLYKLLGLPADALGSHGTETRDAVESDGATESGLIEITIRPGGPSTRGVFLLRPGEGERIAARVIILHANRVLQTALLEGPVVDRDDPPSPADEARLPTITLHAEGILRTSFDELDDRQSFDAALIANELLDRATLTAVVGTEVKLAHFDEGKQVAENIRAILKEVVESPGDFTERDSEALRDLLVRLAYQGAPLYDSLLRDFGLGKGLRDTTLRVQLISSRPEAYLPLELLYEGDAPDLNAPLCPERSQALQLGSCASCPNRRSSAFVCPVRFWGLSKIIERHAFSGEATPASDLIRLDAPLPEDRHFPPPSVGIFARSGRAELFPGGPQANQAVLDSLAATAGTALSAEAWPHWIAQTHQHAPTLIVLLPHTDRTRYGSILEIGSNSQLNAAQINRNLIGAAEKVIVILLGCDTADPSTSYTSFPTRFRLAGANIVVGTLTPVLGRHAAPVAKALIDHIRGFWLSQEGATLGEAMAGVRRRFMEQGLPVGLALIAYGDADWVLRTE
jgi:hypothetical protein